MGIQVGERGELHAVPAMAWVASFVVCGIGDAMLGRWVLLPLFVAAFYGGMIIIDLITYPMLSFWRGWLRRRGLVAWYLVEIVGLWGGTTLVLFLLSRCGWDGTGMGRCRFRCSAAYSSSLQWWQGRGRWRRWGGQGCCSPEPCSRRGPGPRRTAFRNAWW